MFAAFALSFAAARSRRPLPRRAAMPPFDARRRAPLPRQRYEFERLSAARYFSYALCAERAVRCCAPCAKQAASAAEGSRARPTASACHFMQRCARLFIFALTPLRLMLLFSSFFVYAQTPAFESAAAATPNPNGAVSWLPRTAHAGVHARAPRFRQRPAAVKPAPRRRLRVAAPPPHACQRNADGDKRLRCGGAARVAMMSAECRVARQVSPPRVHCSPSSPRQRLRGAPDAQRRTASR